jgi:hypothetical protein
MNTTSYSTVLGASRGCECISVKLLFIPCFSFVACLAHRQRFRHPPPLRKKQARISTRGPSTMAVYSHPPAETEPVQDTDRRIPQLYHDLIEYIIHSVAVERKTGTTLQKERCAATFKEGEFTLKDRFSLCLVSRRWLVPARRHLYRTIPYLHEDEMASNFVLAVRNYPEIRLYVKRLYIIASTEVISVVSLLPRCRSVICNAEIHTSIQESLPSLEMLTALRLTNAVVRSRTIHDFWGMFGQWPHLQVLEIDDGFMTGKEHRTFPSSTNQLYLPSLHDLQLHRFQNLPRIPLTSNTLKTFILKDSLIWDTVFMLKTILQHAKSLTRLEINKVDHVRLFPKDLLTSLSSLEYASLPGVLWADDEENLFSALPKSLHKLHCSCSIRSLHAHFLRALSEGFEVDNPAVWMIKLSIYDPMKDVTKEPMTWIPLRDCANRVGISKCIGGMCCISTETPMGAWSWTNREWRRRLLGLIMSIRRH